MGLCARASELKRSSSVESGRAAHPTVHGGALQASLHTEAILVLAQETPTILQYQVPIGSRAGSVTCLDLRCELQRPSKIDCPCKAHIPTSERRALHCGEPAVVFAVALPVCPGFLAASVFLQDTDLPKPYRSLGASEAPQVLQHQRSSWGFRG